MKIAFIILQHLLPKQLLSRVTGYLAECRTPWLKNALIKLFIRHYQVNMSEAEHSEAEHYANFNAFFTRALRDGARPVAEGDDTLVCPADGAISQLGKINVGRIFQAKGQDYGLSQLLAGDDTLASQFQDGSFATIYLSPRDYHRVHMPITGTLKSMHYVPGELFSVNQTTAENVQGLFARNERLIAVFETAAGPMAMILVGALIVAGIETVWAGQVAPPPKHITHRHYPHTDDAITLAKGEEMGRFKLGSTVILLFGKDKVDWLENYQALTSTRLGEALAKLK